MIINLQKQQNKYPKEVMLKQNYTPLFKNANAQIGLFLEAGEILESGKLENGMYRIEFFALPCFLEVTEKEYKKYFRELDPYKLPRNTAYYPSMEDFLAIPIDKNILIHDFEEKRFVHTVKIPMDGFYGFKECSDFGEEKKDGNIYRFREYGNRWAALRYI